MKEGVGVMFHFCDTEARPEGLPTLPKGSSGETRVGAGGVRGGVNKVEVPTHKCGDPRVDGGEGTQEATVEGKVALTSGKG